MKPPITIIDAIKDPNIIGDQLSVAQEAALKAVYGLPLEGEQLALAQQMAGAAWQPGAEQREAVFICGRRSGKSDKLAANVAIYEAFFRNHDLSAGAVVGRPHRLHDPPLPPRVRSQDHQA